MAFSAYRDYQTYRDVEDHRPDHEIYRNVLRNLDQRLSNIEHYLEYRMGDMMQLDKLQQAAALLRDSLVEVQEHGVRMESTKKAIGIVEGAFPAIKTK